MTSETQLIIERYSRRKSAGVDKNKNLLNPNILYRVQERQRAIVTLLKNQQNKGVDDISLLEIGCGNGVNLLEFLRIGFSAHNLVGNELLKDSAALAKNNLPRATKILEGDATKLDITKESFDIIYQATVFSSILDNDFQVKLASLMWDWVKPGGSVLWYDFIFNNPSNPDVRGVPLKRVRELFPDGKMIVKRITLAPPISRRICKTHPYLYHLFNMIPWLRTHVLIWIEKPKANT